MNFTRRNTRSPTTTILNERPPPDNTRHERGVKYRCFTLDAAGLAQTIDLGGPRIALLDLLEWPRPMILPSLTRTEPIGTPPSSQLAGLIESRLEKWIHGHARLVNMTF